MYVIASCPSVSLILIRTYSRCVHPESVLSYCDDPFRFFSRDTHSQREEQCRPVTQVLQAARGSTLESITCVSTLTSLCDHSRLCDHSDEEELLLMKGSRPRRKMLRSSIYVSCSSSVITRSCPCAFKYPPWRSHYFVQSNDPRGTVSENSILESLCWSETRNASCSTVNM